MWICDDSMRWREHRWDFRVSNFWGWVTQPSVSKFEWIIKDIPTILGSELSRSTTPIINFDLFFTFWAFQFDCPYISNRKLHFQASIGHFSGSLTYPTPRTQILDEHNTCPSPEYDAMYCTGIVKSWYFLMDNNHKGLDDQILHNFDSFVPPLPVTCLISKHHMNRSLSLSHILPITLPWIYSKNQSLYHLILIHRPSRVSTNFCLPAWPLETCSASLANAIEDLPQNIAVEMWVSNIKILDPWLNFFTSIDIPLYVVWLRDTMDTMDGLLRQSFYESVFSGLVKSKG